MGSAVRFTWILILVAAIYSPADSLAQWAPGGIPVPGLHGNNQRVISDGQGGTFIGCLDYRTFGTTGYDVFAQRLTGAGTPAPGFPGLGVPVCTTEQDQYFNWIAKDGQGGAFLGWSDSRNVGNFSTPCVQRVSSSGVIAAGWPIDGIATSTLGSAHGGPQIAPDASGGAFLVWTDERNDAIGDGEDLYAQHLTAVGGLADGWSPTGNPLAAGPGNQYMNSNNVLPDGGGGLIAFWGDGRPDAPGVYMQHILGDGKLAPTWPTGGLRVLTGPALMGAVPDGAGGFYLGLVRSSYVYQADSTYYIARVTDSGQIVPGWGPNGTLVCEAPFVRNNKRIASDAAGHVFMSWDDYRGSGYSHIYATEFLPNGSLAPGWAANGTPVTNYPGYQFTGDLLADEAGGAYIAGEYDGSGAEFGFIQHLAVNGAPAAGWTAAGTMLNALTSQVDARMATDGAGGAFVVWDNQIEGKLYAQHFPGDGATATLLSLVSAEAQADRVALLWQGDAALTASASVERRGLSTDWQDIGAPVLDGSDRLRYEDRDVVGATRYAYRLRYALGSTERTTSETWVDVPGAAQLSLAGLRPNPARGSDLHVSFSLPDAGPARLELIDVAGRRVAMRDVGALGAGTHVEPLRTDSSVPAGLYWLRLTQGTRSLVTRAVVTG